MARPPGVKTRTQGGPSRPAKPAAAGPGKTALATPTVAAAPVVAKRRVGLMQFLQEVRVEARRITWPSWKESWITSVMVGIMVVTTAIFFLVVDWGLSLLIQQILKLAV